ncbi:MAG TPA: hypothetical protein VFY88_05750, partial [Intrasporangium sp.]|nr:hypothetical protein [Intrasporangium sp.]
PTIVWPAWTLTFPTGEGDAGSVALVQRYWSWGHLELRSESDTLQVPVIPLALAPLLVHVLVLVASLAATGVALVHHGRHAQKLGLAGAVAGWVLVADGVAGRTPERDLWETFSEGPLEASTTPAGLGENAALVVLTGALVLLLGRSAVRVATLLWRQLSVRAQADREAEDGARRETGMGAGGIIVHGVRPSDSTVPRWSSPDEGVPFTDLSPDDDRFWPPKQL